ncbi:MAG: murein transglycosylase A [Rhodocyclaceae bacterium]|nr:murein transglycosylase A [Rhodocyclaceae bacterium]
MYRSIFFCFAVLALSGCAGVPQLAKTETAGGVCPPCAACPACPGVEPVKPPEKPLQPAAWADLPGWDGDDLRPAFDAFKTSCTALGKKETWRATCDEARTLAPSGTADLRAWFEARFKPWQLVNADGNREGLVTGYYEPVLKGSRSRQKSYLHPVFAPPEDMVTVELGELYPELKHMRLRGRIEGRKLVPYWSRADWVQQEGKRSPEALLWLDDALDFFFMQIQGSGQVLLDDGSRIRLGYADQNGHPYRSIGRWLIDQGEIKAEQASMQGIKAWARAHPQRAQELMNANPSLVFFRELPAEGSGPPGAMGLALTPERSIAVDPRNVPLGAPVWLAATWPDEARPLQRLMLAQDTGGAIRGAVRADFYWGSGPEAGAMAGRMKQKGRMWVLMPQDYAPK